MPETATKLSPHDHNRRMTLEEFDHAEAAEGYLFELGRGIINVSDVPGKKHFKIVNHLRNHLAIYATATRKSST